MERDPDRRAYAFAVGGGTLLWLAAMAASGKREAWDSGIYWIGAYPLAILLAAWPGYEFPRRAWRWGLAILLAQAAPMAEPSPRFHMLPFGLQGVYFLALPHRSAA